MKHTELNACDKKSQGITITWQSYERQNARKRRSQNYDLHHNGERTPHVEHATSGEGQPKQGEKARKNFHKMER